LQFDKYSAAYKAANNPVSDEVAVPTPSTKSSAPSDQATVSGYGGDWLAKSLASRHVSDQSLPKDSRAELTTYLAESLHPLDPLGNTDILKWWKVSFRIVQEFTILHC
jgi:hypothetical protein